jgi:hypothetical protein
MAEIESMPNQGFKLRQELSEWRGCKGVVIVDYTASNGMPFTLGFEEGPGEGGSKSRYRVKSISIKGRMSNEQMHNIRRLVTERHKMPQGDPFDRDPYWWEKKSPHFKVTVLATRLRDNPVAQVLLAYEPAKEVNAVLAAQEECQPGYRDPRMRWEAAIVTMQHHCMDRLCLGMTLQQVAASPHRRFRLDGALASIWECKVSLMPSEGIWREEGEVAEAEFVSESGALFRVLFKDGPGGEDPRVRYRVRSVTLEIGDVQADDLDFLRRKLTERYKFKHAEGGGHANGAEVVERLKRTPMFGVHVKSELHKKRKGTLSLFIPEWDRDILSLLMERPECRGQGPKSAAARRANLPKF